MKIKIMVIIAVLFLSSAALAGPPIFFGGSSGSIATDTIWQAKGDLAIGTGASTASRLAAGSDYSLFYWLSTEATGGAKLPPVANSIVSYDGTGQLVAGTIISISNKNPSDVLTAQFYDKTDPTKKFGIDPTGVTTGISGWLYPQVTVEGKKYILPSIAVDTYIPAGNVVFSGPTTTQRTITMPDANTTIGVTDIASFGFDGSGSAISTTGTKRCRRVKFASTITGYSLEMSGSSTSVFKVYKDAFSTSTLPTTDITGGNFISTSAVLAKQDDTLTGWTVSVAAGDVICAECTTNNNATWASLIIHGRRD